MEYHGISVSLSLSRCWQFQGASAYLPQIRAASRGCQEIKGPLDDVQPSWHWDVKMFLSASISRHKNWRSRSPCLRRPPHHLPPSVIMMIALSRKLPWWERRSCKLSVRCVLVWDPQEALDYIGLILIIWKGWYIITWLAKHLGVH